MESNEVKDIWRVLRDTSRELGFDRVEMQLFGQLYSECVRMYDTSEAVWTAEVPLGGSDYVRLTRSFDEVTHQAAMGPFMDTVRKTLKEKHLSHYGGQRARAAGA